MPTYGGGPNPPVRLDKWQNIINVSWNLNISELSIISLYQANSEGAIVSGYFDFCARMDFFQAQQRWAGGSDEISPTYNGVIGPFWGFTPTPISTRAENREGYYRLDTGGDPVETYRLPAMTYSGTDQNGNPKNISLNGWDTADDNYSSLSDPDDLGRMFLWYCGDPDVGSNAPARYTTFIVNNQHVSRYFFANTGYPRRGGGLGQNKGQPNFTVQLIAFPKGSSGSSQFRIRVANVRHGKDPTVQSALQFGANQEVQLTNARFTGYTDMEFADGNYLNWFSGGLYSFDRTSFEILNNIEEWQNSARVTPW